MKKIIIITLLFFVSSAFAEDIDSFDGLQSKKKDGVIIIDYTPTADRKKMKREAEYAHKKAYVREKAIIRQNKIEREYEKAKAISKKYRSESSKSYSSQSTKSYSSSNSKIKYHRKKLREYIQKEQDHVGPLPQSKYDAIQERKKYHQNKIKDIQVHPEDY